MRVLHVASWYPHDADDIAGVFIRDHIRCLAPHVEQRVVVPSIKTAGALETDRTLSVARPHLRHRRGVWLIPYIQAVAREAEAFRPDLLHAHVTRPAGVACAWVARRRSIPHIITEHTGPFSALFQTHRLNREAAHWALRSAQSVTAVSHRHAEAIRAVCQDVHPLVVPNTVDVSRFVIRGAAARNVPHLLFVGRLVPDKGCDRLIDALSLPGLRSRPWSLEIVGEGPERVPLEARARILGDRVTFRGYQPPGAIPEIASRADVFVLASLRESFGVVLIEALAAGIPVLATRCGGPEDIVTEEVGRLVPVADTGALADGIAWMLDNHHTFHRETLRAFVARRFGFEVVAQRFLEIYRAALAMRPPS